jgi:hypothetical protein
MSAFRELAIKECEVSALFDSIFRDRSYYTDTLFSKPDFKRSLEGFRADLIQEIYRQDASFDYPLRTAKALLALRKSDSSRDFNYQISVFEKEVSNTKLFPELKRILGFAGTLTLASAFLILGLLIQSKNRTSGFAEFLGLIAGPLLMMLTMYKGMPYFARFHEDLVMTRERGLALASVIREAHESGSFGDRARRASVGAVVPFH